MRSELLRGQEQLHQHSVQRVSIVVAALNEGRNIQKIIDSIEAQKRPEGLEIALIVSDNGSYDEETLAEYTRLLQTEQPIELAIIQGSRRGRLGSVREYGVRAAIDLFRQKHPESKSSSHIIIGGFDADTPLDPKYDIFNGLVERFNAKPEAKIAYGPIPLSTTKHGTVEWTSKLVRPVYNNSFLQKQFRRNKRTGLISEFIHDPKQLFQGGGEIFTQEAYEKLRDHFGSAYNLD